VGQEWPVKVALQIAKALEYLHAHGVVHGSLKTKEVLLDRDGNPKIADYGFVPAKLSALSASLALPPPSACCYVAPEVLAGQPPSFNSDVYRHLSSPPPPSPLPPPLVLTLRILLASLPSFVPGTL
jgi:serine/threonine protein kinase